MQRRVIGFDVNRQRLTELQAGHDRTNETTSQELQAAVELEFTGEPDLLASADVFIVTVPTPIDSAKQPDLTPLERASATVGRALAARAQIGAPSLPVVIYESTVYPGATEEVCVPILERESSLHFNRDFVCGYSPERINPGDKEHRLTNIVKVTSGSTMDSSAWIDNLYGAIVKAGTHRASCIKVAEAAKVIENTQRDLNIALVNELAIIFREMNIDTLDVLEAARTKWNFLPFRPGLVGGHCIGVDPYYLTYKAELLGYYPQVVLAGRRINDGMGRWVVEQVVLGLAQRRQEVVGAKVLVLGFTFKENCPDMRNTKVATLIDGLTRYGMSVDVVDPYVNSLEVQRTYNLNSQTSITPGRQYAAVVVAVAHRQFADITLSEWESLLIPGGLLFDLKGILPRELDAVRP